MISSIAGGVKELVARVVRHYVWSASVIAMMGTRQVLNSQAHPAPSVPVLNYPATKSLSVELLQQLVLYPRNTTRRYPAGRITRIQIARNSLAKV